MAAAVGRSSRDLTGELAADASGYEFFQAVRLLSLTARRTGDLSSDELPPRLRFRTAASLSFPPSELFGYSPADASAPPADEVRDEMTVALFRARPACGCPGANAPQKSMVHGDASTKSRASLPVAKRGPRSGQGRRRMPPAAHRGSPASRVDRLGGPS